MKSKTYLLLALMLALGLMLAACGGTEDAADIVESTSVQEVAAEPTEAPVDEPTDVPEVEATEKPEEEPVAEEPAVEEPAAEEPAEEAAAFPEADLDAAFVTFLDGMVGYNTQGLDGLNEILIEDPPPFLLDVRQPEELAEKGHIEGAVNIPLRELGQNIDLLPSFDTPIVSYCGSGWRCTIAMTELGALGWENVLSLKGGSFGGWLEGGYPVVEGAAAEPMVLEVAQPDPALLAVADRALSNIPEGWGGITAEQLNTDLAENPDLVVIDVRRQEEVDEKGVIEADNYIHIPLEEFVAQKDLWPADPETPIVIYCGSGHRSTMAMAILWAYGHNDVRSLKGGFGGWAEAGYPVVDFQATTT
jgi:rhodanese-related sulfurtransferase